jgi:hypothetical protein
MDSVRPLSQLGLAQWNNGQGRQARAHAYESLRLAAQVVDPWSLLTSISTAVAILADGEDPERAIELHSMLMQDPLCAASRWYEDGVRPHVAAAIEKLPDEAVELALSRGISLDQQAEAQKLVNEVFELGWPR